MSIFKDNVFMSDAYRHLRFVSALKEIKSERQLNYVELAGEINRFVPQGEKKLDRRKLSDLLDEKYLDNDISLSFQNLCAIDEYLKKYKQDASLAVQPLLGGPGILQEMAVREVTYLLGSEPSKGRLLQSGWDTRSVGSLQKSLHDMGSNRAYEIEDVIKTGVIAGGSDAASRANLRKKISNRELVSGEQWESLLHLESGDPVDRKSVVVIGSPRANTAAELMLSMMFAWHGHPVTPFNSAELGSLPFYFLWPKSESVSDSAFASSQSGGFDAFDADLADYIATGKEADFTPRAIAYRLKDAADFEYYSIREYHKKPEEWSTAGIIAAMGANGHLFVSIMGVSGIATLGTAQALPLLTHPINIPGASNESGKIIWAPVKIDVRKNAKNDGDRNQIQNVELMADPQYWPPG